MRLLITFSEALESGQDLAQYRELAYVLTTPCIALCTKIEPLQWLSISMNFCLKATALFLQVLFLLWLAFTSGS